VIAAPQSAAFRVILKGPSTGLGYEGSYANEYLITLDSHEYFGPFLTAEDAHYWAKATQRTSYQLVSVLPSYAKDQVRQPHHSLKELCQVITLKSHAMAQAWTTIEGM